MEKKSKNATKKEEAIEINKKYKKKESPYKSKKYLKDNYNKENALSFNFYDEILEELSKKKANKLDINDVQEEDKEIREIYSIIQDKKIINEIHNLLSLFKKTKMNEFLKSDLLFTGLEIDDLTNYMISFISLYSFNLNKFIYSYGDPGENIYLILKGKVGLFNLIQTEELLSSEEYYLYLYNQYNIFRELIIGYNQRNKTNNININEFTDINLLIDNVNKNKNFFPLYSLDDIPDLNKIILSIKLYIQFLENRKEKISDFYKKLKIPFEYMNFDKFLKRQISLNTFIEELSKNIKDREKYYMKYLGKDEKYKVKIFKFVKYNDLKEYCYFGNFEINDTKPIRKDYALSESDSNILLLINKKEYSKIVNKLQKEKRKKEIDFLYNNFFFKTINRIYFETKIFIKFKIDQFYKGHILVNQDEKINKFIFMKEGIIKSSINNISLLEFPQKIRNLYDFIIKKAKEYEIDLKTLIDFDIKLTQKTNLKYELIKDVLNKKQNFTITKTEKGIIGDYEYFFKVPSFITSTVISKNNLIFFYDFENFKIVNNEFHAFKENLKKISFYKLKSILKRMISIYNSFFSFNMKIIEDKLIDNGFEVKENKIKDKDILINLNNSTEIKKKLISTTNISRNQKVNINNFFNAKNINYISKYDEVEENSKNKAKINNLFSTTNLNTKKLNNYKYFHSLKNKKNKYQNKLLLNKGKTINNDGKIFRSLNFSFKKIRKNLLNKNLKFNNNENIKKGKVYPNNSDSETDESNINNMKLGRQMKEKILDIFLPPLSKTIKIKIWNIENRKINIDRHLTRHALHTINSINNTSLGHTDENNIDEKLLSNFYFEKSNKSKSTNIKKAQILLLKNRNKKAKLILQKKIDSEYFLDEDIF